MSVPKSILAALYTRINSALGATFTVSKGKRDFSPQELPAIALFRERWERSSEEGERALMADALVIVEAHKAFGTSAPSDVAEDLIATIRSAIETTDRSLGGALRLPGIILEAHEVNYPENADSLIAVRLEYSAPHVEKYGNP